MMARVGRAAAMSVAMAMALLPCSCGSNGDTDASPIPHRLDGGADAASDAGKKDSGLGCATCESLGANCGSAPDGCGGVLQCGACESGIACGGDGPNRCGSKPCSPLACASTPGACGVVSDGCGSTVDCGACPAGQSCGAGGVPNRCGCPAPTCSALGVSCGSAKDACGQGVDCGGCSGGAPCISGKCCSPNCDGADCGDSDGCGGKCGGSCPWSQTCNSSHECVCGPSPNFKVEDGVCKPSCGKWLGHQGYNNVNGGCCPNGCRDGVRGSDLNETHDCAYCCESFTGQVSCK